MRRRRLVGHFLSQFVEDDWSADIDKHQMLALVAAGIVTIPLFVTIFMSMRYLVRPFQSAGWTEVTGMEDQITFCVISMLVAAVVATLEWDALGLSPRDTMILGVLPVPHREIVAAKIIALILFVGFFVAALNLLPALLHPSLMVAALPLNLAMVPLLMASHILSTTVAAAFGFASVVGIRELLYLALGPAGLQRVSGLVRSALLLTLLLLVAVAPVRLSGRADWMLQAQDPPLALRPVAWSVAAHALIAGRVLQQVPERQMPRELLSEERRLRRQYEDNLPKLTSWAIEGAGALILLLAATSTMQLWNARHLQHLVLEGGASIAVPGLSRLLEPVARTAITPPARCAGFLFLFRTLLGSPVHLLYGIVAVAAGIALFLAMAPFTTNGAPPPVRTLHLAAQTLALIAIVTGFRAAIRTAADERAGWVFGVADTGHLALFRNGVRLGAITAVVATVALLAPLHAAAWGPFIAGAHAVNGVAVGWLLVEAVSAGVENPLVVTVPPNDGLNTEGAVFVGAMVIAVFVLARVERAALAGAVATAMFAATILLLAAGLRYAVRAGQADSST